MRLLWLFVGLAALVLIIFFVWGDSLMSMFTHDGTVAWLSRYGDWAWFAAIVLLMADLLLPLPATLIMSALGYFYGAVGGGIIATVGSFLAGSLGYWVCRMMGENAALKLLGSKDYERGKKLAGGVGGWVVVLSRWLPVFPEVVACMAGLTRMRPGYFHAALLCGSIPLGFTYAYVGATGQSNPTLAILLSACLPPVMWLMIRWLLKSRMGVES